MTKARTSLAAAFVALLAGRSYAQSPRDPAARGLDAFVHAPDSAPQGGFLPVDLEVVGYSSPLRAAPLAGAEVEAVWDGDLLGPGVRAPSPIRVTTDNAGKAQFRVPIPPGEEATLKLLGLRSGEHQRTRAIEVTRIKADEVKLYVTEDRVVPGGETTAWVRVTRLASGAPVVGAALELALSECGVTRGSQRLVTDAAGAAMARVAIPRVPSASWAWQLSARMSTPGGRAGGESSVTLTPRDESPGSPLLTARWGSGEARFGDRVAFAVLARDAMGEAIAGQAVRVWVGPKAAASRSRVP